MGFTDKFRAQHEEILAVAREITQRLQQPGLDAPLLRKLLSNLAGKVSFHLAMEDDALYPRLKGQQDSRANQMATKFMTEMGGLAAVFAAYNAKWQVSAIKADPERFAEETRKVFGALAHRIQRENKELYPLADVGT